MKTKELNKLMKNEDFTDYINTYSCKVGKTYSEVYDEVLDSPEFSDMVINGWLKESNLELKKVKYSVYGLKDPIDMKIKYVGVTKNITSRYKQHLYSIKICDKTKWIEELKKSNLRPELVILETIFTNDRNAALNKEKKYITKYKDDLQ